MLIRLGYELAYEFPQATPMILNLNVHYSRASDWVRADTILTEPAVPLATYRDSFGNWCTRATAPAGQFRVTSDALIKDAGIADPSFPHAFEHTVDSLPDDTLVFLLPSRYCETELLSPTAWSLFGGMMPGWSRVQAICDFVHQHVAFDYQCARPTKTAWETYNERRGGWPGFSHLPLPPCPCFYNPAPDFPRYFAGNRQPALYRRPGPARNAARGWGLCINPGHGPPRPQPLCGRPGPHPLRNPPRPRPGRNLRQRRLRLRLRPWRRDSASSSRWAESTSIGSTAMGSPCCWCRIIRRRW